jgi:alpha,alpha-trehalase
MKRRPLVVTAFLLLSTLLSFAQTAAPAKSGLTDIRAYIQKGWQTLQRSANDCHAASDERKQQAKPVIYFPADAPLPPIAADLEKRCGVEARQLPKVITGPGQFDLDNFSPHGVLYLPNPYVVPGGMFNEMYGWDSYFIIRGLLIDGHYDLARGMVENFFYEIEHYGSVLNANRTYFLSRSQPPFLSAMVMAVYDAKPDKQWLTKAYSYILRDYQMWTSEPHLAGNTGLSRYFDFGQGPTPDIAATGDPYYAELITALASNGIGNDYVAKSAAASASSSKNEVIGPNYTLTSCIENHACAQVAKVSLTADYYKGDRSMRESGFDVSSRFAPYSGHTHHFAPVCLNSLLYQTERNLQKIAELIGKPGAAREWSDRAQLRGQRINRLMWNAQKKMFFDWDFVGNKQSDYQYATTFYPLWVGLATQEQAKAIVSNLKTFEHPGGIVMSPYDTRLQWDYPYGWAPVNLIDIEGLRAYKADADANRLSVNFLSMIVENFRKDGTIREKYNVVTRSDEQNVAVGYHVNIVGFGWTNGTFLALLKALPPEQQAKVSP